jgi:MFS transporter, DHA1 family, tetracycline resistance protein
MAAAGKARKAAVIFIFITVLMDMLAFGIIIPVMPKLILDMSGGNESTATSWNALLGTGWALMQFIWSPILGALSDRYGRRPVILLSNFGLTVDYVLIALAPDLWWLLVARLLSGVVAASVTTANAYIADVTAPEDRAKAFGMLGAAFGLGFVIGPVMGGWLGHFDPRLPFWVAAALAFLNGCYGYFVLPESLPKEQRSSFSWAKANPVGGFRFLLDRPGLLGFTSMNFIAQLAHFALPSIFGLYILARYNWGPLEGGWLLGAVGISSIIVQGFLVGRFGKALGMRTSIIGGYLFGAAGLAIFAIAPTGPWLYLGIPVMALWGFAGPSIQSLMSRQVSPSDQGKLQGMNTGVMAMAGMFGPTLYSIALDKGIHMAQWPGFIGLPFYISAALLLCCAMMAMAMVRNDPTPVAEPAL